MKPILWFPIPLCSYLKINDCILSLKGLSELGHATTLQRMCGKACICRATTASVPLEILSSLARTNSGNWNNLT
jgi:hypothetical protein